MRIEDINRYADAISRWEDVELLKNLYHKARYSGAKVSRLEYNALRERRDPKEAES